LFRGVNNISLDAKGRMAAYYLFEGSLEPAFRKLHHDIEMLTMQEQTEADIVADNLFTASQKIIKYNIAAIVTVFIAAIVLGLFVSRSFTRSLDKLTSASLQISKGNLDQQLQLNTGDELQILAETFNSMLHSLKEYRDHMENMVEDRTVKLNTAKKAAEQASEIKSQFMSRVSHELRTPLNAALGFGQLLREEETDVGKIEQLDGILCAGQHLLGLIDEVLAISRIETDEIEASIENVSLSIVLAECISIVQPVAAECKVTLSNNYANFPHVKANSFRLKQILLNILSNAIKYNREQGTVSIDYTIVNGDRVRLEIVDTGFGITPDKKLLVFEPFMPVATDKKIVEGSGIGLTITKKLIEAMGGSIGFESEEGIGSTFWIELPLGLSPVESHPEVADSTG